jgi:hypothetical protein
MNAKETKSIVSMDGKVLQEYNYADLLKLKQRQTEERLTITDSDIERLQS